jgi:hypothetical protein
MQYEWEEADKEHFVKLYLTGLKQAAGLTKAASSCLNCSPNRADDLANLQLSLRIAEYVP